MSTALLRGRGGYARLDSEDGSLSDDAAADDGWAHEARAGPPSDPVPYREVLLAIGLLLAGCGFAALARASALGKLDGHVHPGATGGFATLAALTFLPGFYTTRLAFYAARGRPGYSFADIPRGGLGERQEVGCVLSGAVLSTGEGALLLVHLPPGIGPDNAWLAGAAVAGSGGVVACGASDAPLQGSGVPGCPALLQGNNASTSLAACLPPSATAHPARFYLRTPLPAACTDEGVAARAQPALLAVAAAAAAGDNGAVAFNSFALRARLPAPLPSSWLGGSVTVSLPPPVLVAVARGGAARVVAVATATTGAGTQWVVPAPGGKGAGVVGLVTAGAVLGSTALMVGAVVRERTLTATKAA